MPLALEGIRIIDVSQGVSGPLGSMMLGDLGAEIIKVEPTEGDWLRQIGPFEKGESSLFIRLNRNRRGICLDLKSPAGREALVRLVQGADAFIEGYRPGAMDRLGLGYDDLSAVNPGLIYCSISGMGSQGPMAEHPATELDVQAIIGKYRHLGRADEPPLRVGFDVVSENAGWAAAQAVVIGIMEREATGLGQHAETSLLDAAVNLMQWATAAESAPDEWKGKQLAGYTEPPDHGFRCKDANFLLDMGRVEEEWKQFCLAVGADDVAHNPLYDSFAKRLNWMPTIREEMAAALEDWTFDDLEKLARGMGATIVRMNTFDSLMNHPQVEALEMVRELEHPVVGRYRTLDIPWDFSEPIARLAPAPAPTLGQHTRELLAEVGYSEAEISGMYAEGAAG